MTSRNLRPVLATSDGFVVTPSSRPVAASSRISPVSAVSTKNFMDLPGSFPRLTTRARGWCMPVPHASSTDADAGAASRLAVLLPLPLAGPYDYRADAALALKRGDFVIVPLGKREVVGVVWGEGRGDVDDAKL